MELAGQEKCVNMFVYGESPTVPNTWKGIVHVIGDVMANNITMEPGTEAYVAVGDIADIFGDLWAEYGYALSGINTGNRVPGVKNGQPYFDDKNHVSIQILGNLTAEGTEDQPIIITSAATEPTIYDWNTFVLESRVNLSYFTLEYHRDFVVLNPKSSNSNREDYKVIINNSVFRHTGGQAMWIEGGATVYINNTHIYDAQHEGIGGGIPANSIFINNTIEQIADEICLVIRQDYTDSTRPDISGNTLNCYTGIYIGADTISLNNEQLQSLADYYLPQNNFGEMTRYRFAVFKDTDDQTPVFSIK
ncbi:MAG: right-handed parallel beta-helix repeat-containing protein [Nanoarchaeota archaeon]